MNKIKNFCGIFATVFVTTTMVILASCSQDDDYYDNSEMYTLAEEMGTRSGGGDPGGQPSPVYTYITEDPITELHEFYFVPNSEFYSPVFQNNPLVALDPSLCEGAIEADISVCLVRVDNQPIVSSFTNFSITSFFTVNDVFLAPDETVTLPGRYILYATGTYIDENNNATSYTAFIPNRLYN